MIATSGYLTALKCTKFVCKLHSAPQTLPAGLRGPTSKGKGERKGREESEKGKGDEGEGRGREEPPLPTQIPWIRPWAIFWLLFVTTFG